MPLVDKMRAKAEEAAAKAREAAHDAQLKHELGNVYDELGRLTFDLFDKGEVTHPAIEEKAERIRTLRAELEHGPE